MEKSPDTEAPPDRPNFTKRKRSSSEFIFKKGFFNS